MSIIESKTEWQGGFAFNVQAGNHTLTVDAPKSIGGEDSGPKPTHLLLAGLMGCTGIDVVSILKKMRVSFEKFSMDTRAKAADEDPHVFQVIDLYYYFEGKEELLKSQEQIKKAIRLSRDKYCSISIMFSAFCKIHRHVLINGEEIEL